MGFNKSANDYIDYLYDDSEDFASNVDYATSPDSYKHLLLPSQNPPENPFHYIVDLAHYFLFYDGQHFLGLVSQGLLILALWSTAYFVLNRDFPGNPHGKLWPIYIPEHYGVRNSQHLFDPYR